MIPTILITAGVIFFATTVFLLVRFYFTDRRRMTSMTEGRVLRAEERSVVVKDLRHTETEIIASYTARGQDYEVRRTIQGSKSKAFPPGKPVPVRYNPGEPDMSELAL